MLYNIPSFFRLRSKVTYFLFQRTAIRNILESLKFNQNICRLNLHIKSEQNRITSGNVNKNLLFLNYKK